MTRKKLSSFQSLIVLGKFAHNQGSVTSSFAVKFRKSLVLKTFSQPPISMVTLYKIKILMAVFFALATSNFAIAGDVKILAVDFYKSTNSSWLVKVTLEHSDTGWDHYADNWQVVDAEGNVLGNRILHHPHVQEQPFTRNLAGVKVPDGVTTIFIKAHDKVHGWTTNKLKVDLNKAIDKHLRVEAN